MSKFRADKVSRFHAFRGFRVQCCLAICWLTVLPPCLHFSSSEDTYSKSSPSGWRQSICIMDKGTISTPESSKTQDGRSFQNKVPPSRGSNFSETPSITLNAMYTCFKSYPELSLDVFGEPPATWAVSSNLCPWLSGSKWMRQQAPASDGFRALGFGVWALGFGVSPSPNPPNPKP